MKTRNLILNAVVLFSLISFTSCDPSDDTTLEAETQTEVLNEVVGEWQMYRDETLESVIDEWTGTEWTTVDTWFSNVREDSEIILEFKEDGTVDSRYADVVTDNGVWESIEQGRYFFNNAPDPNNPNDEAAPTAQITFYCDNTFSIVIEGDDSAIYYYKKIDETECGDLINYNVME